MPPAIVLPQNRLKRKKILFFVICLVFGFAIGAAGYVVYKQYFLKENFNLGQIFPQKSPKLETTANPLDGTQVDRNLANRHPLAIIIENHPAARPQIPCLESRVQSQAYELRATGG